MIYVMKYDEISAQSNRGYYNIAFQGPQELANYFTVFKKVLEDEYPTSILYKVGNKALVEWDDE